MVNKIFLCCDGKESEIIPGNNKGKKLFKRCKDGIAKRILCPRGEQAYYMALVFKRKRDTDGIMLLMALAAFNSPRHNIEEEFSLPLTAIAARDNVRHKSKKRCRSYLKSPFDYIQGYSSLRNGIQAVKRQPKKILVPFSRTDVRQHLDNISCKSKPFDTVSYFKEALYQRCFFYPASISLGVNHKASVAELHSGGHLSAFQRSCTLCHCTDNTHLLGINSHHSI